eukprot:TRINITY_DN16315_c0_g1_i1.p1 TRINITY_DN16315_c0_g1~~TRINITY_DN16315_c0_g1_i1.p1  ORF type:complete len:353 (+),score=47.91 TRINITY_DN16315_c0_g1_i1:56-1114(+)
MDTVTRSERDHMDSFAVAEAGAIGDSIEAIDRYPTRLQAPRDVLMERTDPVVWPARSEAVERTKSRQMLSHEEVEHFNRNGYVVRRGVFSAKEAASMRGDLSAACKRLVDEAKKCNGAVTEKNRVAFEKDRDGSDGSQPLVRSIFEVHKHEMKDVYRDARLVEAAMQLLGDDVYVHQSRANMQPPFVGSGFYWHSDFETWHAEDGMPLPRAVSCVVMLERNEAYNSALMVVPGSHRTFIGCAGETPPAHWEESLRTQKIGTPAPATIADMVERSGGNIAYCTGEPGDVLMFDANLLHGSHSNISPMGRTNLFGVYNAVSNVLGEPYAAPSHRPEHIAVRKPHWQQPIQPVLK